jgi:hypothetical protein
MFRGHSWNLRLQMLTALCAVILALPNILPAQEAMPVVLKVESQPLKAQVKRVREVLSLLGEPLSDADSAKLDAAIEEMDDAKSVKAIQALLDPKCLAYVNINPESRVKSSEGMAPRVLDEQGWRVFLIKVHNEAGVTAGLRVTSPNAAPIYKQSTSSPLPKDTVKKQDIPDRWMEILSYDAQPMAAKLSGLNLEYRVVSLYSRDRGKREGKLAFDVGQGTQDLGFRNEVSFLFECQPAVEVTLDVLDDDAKPTMASFVFKDRQGRTYPARSKRLEPDLFFHDQIYRANGESVRLPAGEYKVTYTRGPEYVVMQKSITVPSAEKHRESFRLKRWIDLAKRGWFSGDHHVHAAGCGHYESPTAGVTPESMMRHILGEDLDVGCVLSWGPCWYHQKEYFDGKLHPLSTEKYLMRYDVEVSGFPSSHAGHLCLLRLKEDDFPGTKVIEDWPSWDLPVLKWGKEQGGVVGFSHSGWGLQMPDDTLPSYKMPPFDGIGANEYVVDVVHDACDFISTVDTPSVWELNIWYHTLNCGYTCRISGETDFPCIYGERVGLGRSYVNLGKDKKLDFDAWTEGIKQGRCYVSDGMSHLIDFQVNGLGVGQPGDKGRSSFIAIKSGESLEIGAKVAALLSEKPDEEIRKRKLDQKPYWHLERARLGQTRNAPVELIVDGYPVERKEVACDGRELDLTFDWKPERSCWVALRIFPSSHTNPVFVEVDGKPIRASRRSAEWCQKACDVCWEKKSPQIRPAERETAKKAYEVARAAYNQIATEAFDDRK